MTSRRNFSLQPRQQMASSCHSNILFVVFLNPSQFFQKEMDRYIVSGRIGEGAHGIVLKGVCKATLKIVALKRIALKNIGEQGLSNAVKIKYEDRLVIISQ